jgi:hypothetical protein
MDMPVTCNVCSRPLRAGFRVQEDNVRCLRHAITYPPIMKRAFITALIVGTVLGLINHGDHLVAGHVTRGEAIQMAVTYLVPFTVSTSGALGAARDKYTS